MWVWVLSEEILWRQFSHWELFSNIVVIVWLTYLECRGANQQRKTEFVENDKDRQRDWEGVESTNKGLTEREKKGQGWMVLRNNDIKMAKAWMIY